MSGVTSTPPNIPNAKNMYVVIPNPGPEFFIAVSKALSSFAEDGVSDDDEDDEVGDGDFAEVEIMRIPASTMTNVIKR